MHVYVCIEAGFCGVPMGKGVQLGLGWGAFKGVQFPNPAGIIRPASLTLAHTCRKPTLLWAAKGEL